MSRSSRLAVIVSVALLAAGCGGDDDEPSTSATFEIGSPASVRTTASGTAFPTVATIGPVTVDTADIPITPFDTGDLPTVPDTADAPVLIEVQVGVDSGPDRIEIVPLGALVRLSIINPTADDEYHLHGYDLGDGQEFAEGAEAEFIFTADRAGDFELESHTTEDVLLILRVQ